MGAAGVRILDNERRRLLSSPGLFMSRVPQSLRAFPFRPATSVAAVSVYGWRYWSASEGAFALA